MKKDKKFANSTRGGLLNKKAFTLIELLAIIVILAIIAVITVPIILNVIDNAKVGSIQDSAYGYKDAVNKYYVSELYENPDLKLEGTYLVDEGTMKGMDLSSSSYTDTLDIAVSGTTPTGGYLNYENNVLKDGCLTVDEYKVTIENGEVKTTEKGSCQSISLTACDSSNFHPSPENWFTFDETTGTITGFSENWDGTTDITIPCQINGVDVVNVGSGAFSSTNILTGVVLNDNIISIGAGSFYNNKIKNLILGNNVVSIGNSSFSYNIIDTLSIPDSVEIIEQSAFSYNYSIKELKIGSGLIEIGMTSFSHNSLEQLTIPSNVKKINHNAFSNNKLKDVVIEEGVEYIGESCFIWNDLYEVIIPKTVTTIGSGAFFKQDDSNLRLNTIYNNTGREFAWGTIVGGGDASSYEIGTVVNELGNVEIKKSN